MGFADYLESTPEGRGNKRYSMYGQTYQEEEQTPDIRTPLNSEEANLTAEQVAETDKVAQGLNIPHGVAANDPWQKLEYQAQQMEKNPSLAKWLHKDFRNTPFAKLDSEALSNCHTVLQDTGLGVVKAGDLLGRNHIPTAQMASAHSPTGDNLEYRSEAEMASGDMPFTGFLTGVKEKDRQTPTGKRFDVIQPTPEAIAAKEQQSKELALSMMHGQLVAEGILDEDDVPEDTVTDIGRAQDNGSTFEDMGIKVDLEHQRMNLEGEIRKAISTNDTEALMAIRQKAQALDEQIKAVTHEDPSGFYEAYGQAKRMFLYDLPEASQELLVTVPTFTMGGAVVGSAGAGVGAIPGAIGGFGSGVVAGLTVGGYKVAARMEAANFLVDMINEKDDAGNYLSTKELLFYADLYGAIAGLSEVGGEALMAGVGKVVTKPVATALRSALGSEITKDALKAALKNTSMRATLKPLIMAPAVSAVGEGTTEGFQELANIKVENTYKDKLNEERLNYFRDTQELFTAENMGRVGKSIVTGASVGAWFQAPAVTIRHIADVHRVNKAQKFAEDNLKLAETLSTSKTKEMSPDRIDSYLQSEGMTGQVILPADAALQLQNEGVDICGPLGWDEKTLKQAAQNGQELPLSLSKLHAKMPLDAMKRIIPVLRQDENALSQVDANHINDYLGANVDEAIDLSEREEQEQIASVKEYERLREQLANNVRATPSLQAQIQSSVDPDTTDSAVVNGALSMILGNAKRVAKATGEGLSSVLSRLNIHGAFDDKMARALLVKGAGIDPDNSNPLDIRRKLDPDFASAYGKTDPASFKAKFGTAALNKAKRELGAGFFSKAGEGKAWDEVAQEAAGEHETHARGFRKNGEEVNAEEFWKGVLRSHDTFVDEALKPVEKEGQQPGATGLFQFLGERGAAALDAAEEATTRMDNLDIARDMEKAGEHARAIKLATGWERGADNKWRYEILDGKWLEDAKWQTKQTKDGSATYYEARLADVFNSPELFAAYPEMADMPLIVTSLKDGAQGEYSESTGIYINQDIMRTRDTSKQARLREIEQSEEYQNYQKALAETDSISDPIEAERAYDELESAFNGTAIGKEYNGLLNTNKLTFAAQGTERARDTLLHEIQHAIQSKEGFAAGGNETQAKRAALRAINKRAGAMHKVAYQEYVDNRKELALLHLAIDFRRYVEKPETFLKSAAYLRYGSGVLGALPKKKGSTERASAIYDIINRWHADVKAELVGHDYSARDRLHELETNPDLAALQKEQKAKRSRNSKLLKKIGPYLEYVAEVEKVQGLSDYEAYKRLAGEVEARNVSTRRNMTMEQRRQSLAADTEDVSRQDQLLIQQAIGTASNMERNANNGAALLDNIEQSKGQKALGQTVTSGDTYTISIFNGSNLSTILHELGHVFTLEMQRLEAMGLASEEMVQDIATLREWTSQLDRESTLKEEYDRYQKNTRYEGKNFTDLTQEERQNVRAVAEQEWFARGFEQYLRTGEAPSFSLKAVFRRFRKWLTRVYKQAEDLHVQITDEVKDVFGRMIAAEDEIDLAAYDAEVKELSRKSMDSLGIEGMERLEIEGLIQDVKDEATEKLYRARAKNYKENKARWTSEAQEALEKDKAYKARKAILKTAMDIETLEDLYGADVVKELSAKLKGSLKKKGVSPEIVAAENGYNNALEMINDIVAKPEPSEYVQSYIAEREAEYNLLTDPKEPLFEQSELGQIQERIGKALLRKIDKLIKGAVQPAKKEAYKKEATGKTIMGQEARKPTQEEYALYSKLAEWRVKLEQLNEYVEAEMNQHKMSAEIRPENYRRLAAKWVKEERVALVKENWAKALECNFKARFNLEAARMAAERQQIVKRLQKTLKAAIENKNVDPGIRKALYVINAAYNLLGYTTTKMQRMVEGKSMEDATESLATLTGKDYLPAGTIDLSAIEPGKWQDMNFTQFRDIAEATSMIIFAEKAFRSDTSKGARQDFEDMDSEIADSIYKHNKHREKDLNSTIGNDNAKFWARVKFGAFNFDTFASLLDGNEWAGPFWNATMRKLNAATWQRDDTLQEIRTKLKELRSVYTDKEFSELRSKKYTLKDYGYPEFVLTKEKAMVMLLNAGNEGNLKRLFDGNLQHYADKAGVLQAVIDTLDKRDLDYVQGVWDYFDTFKERAFDIEERLNGVRPVAVKPTPIQTKHGVLRGGYFPIKYDPDAGVNISEKDTDLAGGVQGGMVHPYVQSGSMKERGSHGLGQPLRMTFDTIAGHLTQTAHMMAFREPIREIARLLGSRTKTTKAICSTMGVPAHRAMMDLLRYIAGERPKQTIASKFIGWGRKKMAIFSMGWSLCTAALQMSGILTTPSEIGLKYTLQGMKYFTNNPVKVFHNVCEMSPMMRNRRNAVDREIYEMTSQVLDTGSSIPGLYHLGKMNAWLENNAFYLVGWAQMYFADLPTWTGAYQKALDEGMGHEEAVEYADTVVERTQVGGAEKNLMGWQMGGDIAKAITMYFSYFACLANLCIRAGVMTRRELSLENIQRIGWLTLPVFLEPVLTGWATRRNPEDTQDDWWKFLQWALGEALCNPFQMIPTVRDIQKHVSDVMDGKLTSALRLTPALEWEDAVTKTISEAKKVFWDDKEGRERHLAKQAMKTTGLVFGGPFNAQTLKIYDTFMDWYDGTTEDFEWANIIRKRPKK